MERSYHIHRSGEQFGPYSETQVAEMLAAGALLPEDLAWSEGMPGWQTLASLPAFARTRTWGTSVPATPGTLTAPGPTGSATARYLARQAGRTSGRTGSGANTGVKIGLLSTIGVIVAAGLAWFCASWWMGRSVEPSLRTWMTTMMDAAPGIETRITTFRRGIFSSDCITRITLAGGESPMEFHLRHEVQHGPFLLRRGKARSGACRIITTLDQQSMNDEMRAMIRSAFSNREPLRIASDVDFSGNLALTASVAPFTVDLEDATAKFEGLSGALQIDEEGNRWNGEYALGPIELTEPASAMRIHMAKGTGRIDVDEMASGLVLSGGAGLTIPSITFGGADGGMELEKVQVTTNTRTKAGIQSQETEFSINRISSVGDPLVPVQLEGGLTITGTVEGIDVDALGRFQEAYAKVGEIIAEDAPQWSDAPTDAGPGEMIMAPDAETPAVASQLGTLYAAGLDLVRPGLGAAMTLRLGGSSGDVRLSGSIAFGGPVPLKDTRTLREAAEAIQVRAQIDFPQGFITDPELAAMLDAPLEEGHIVDRGGTYTAIFTLQDGTPRLNAVELPLPEDLLAAMEEPIDWGAPSQLLGAIGTMGASPDQVYTVTINASQVHFAAKLYAEDNDGDYPEAIEDLVREQFIDPTDILEAPAGLEQVPEGAPMFHYRMLGIEDGASQSGDLPFLISVVPIGEEWVVAWNDGRVDQYTAEELAQLAAEQTAMGESEVADAIMQMMADVGM